MDTYVYVDPVNSNLVSRPCAPISCADPCAGMLYMQVRRLSVRGRPLTPSRNPFVDPTSATPCGHTFCRACIDQALDVAQCCPIDRGQLSSADLLPAPSLGKPCLFSS